MKEIIEQSNGDSVSSKTVDTVGACNERYEKPVLICYGDVRDITLGPSPGFGESGAGVFFLQP